MAKFTLGRDFDRENQVLNKADLLVGELQTNGGYMPDTVAAQFLQEVFDSNDMLQRIRTISMPGPVYKVNAVGIGERFLHRSPGSGVALPAHLRGKVTTRQIELVSKEFVGSHLLTYDVLEDNLEQGSFEQTVMTLLASKTAADLEEIVILSNKDFVTGATDYNGNALTDVDADDLSLVNGIIALASTHEIDYTAAPTTVTRAVFKAMLFDMPQRFKRDMGALRFFSSHNNYTEYIDTLADRLTTLGDSAISDTAQARPFGIQLEGISFMPETRMIFTDPQNIILGVHRQIMVESTRDIERRAVVVVLTTRIDVAIETPDAIVQAWGLTAATA